MSGLWQFFLNLGNSPDGGGNGASIVVVVKAVKQASVFADQSHLGGGGAGIDAQVAAAAVGG